jgi:cation:H+ antiporter
VTPTLSVLIGLVMLLVAGDLIVRGAVNMALRLGVPALIVSLTIVAFGTSAPELLVSIDAVLRDAGGLALGNVVGSNVANILLVLGVPAVLARLSTGDPATRQSYLVMLAVSLLFIAVCFFGPIRWPGALVLLAALTVLLTHQFRDARSHARGQRDDLPPDVEGVDPEMSWPRIVIFVVLGLIGLPLGAELLVNGAVQIASDFGVSDRVIGLTVIAIGTSLPELATTVVAALKRQADVAIGNVIGSNIFNLLGIIGVAALIGPIPVDPSFLSFDLWVMLGASVVLAPFVFGWRNLTRRWGALLLALYASYMVLVVAA